MQLHVGVCGCRQLHVGACSCIAPVAPVAPVALGRMWVIIIQGVLVRVSTDQHVFKDELIPFRNDHTMAVTVYVLAHPLG